MKAAGDMFEDQNEVESNTGKRDTSCLKRLKTILFKEKEVKETEKQKITSALQTSFRRRNFKGN